MRKIAASFLAVLSLAVGGCCCTPATGGNVVPRKIERWKQLAGQDEADVVPASHAVQFPSREEWSRIAGRAGTP